jgi:hypothetical protein
MPEKQKKRVLAVGAAFGAGVAAVVVAALGAFAGSGVAASRDKPVNQDPPTISGTPEEGKTLKGNKGTWNNNPSDYNYYWLRCDKTGGSCSQISGAGGSTSYKLTSADVGNTVRFRVQAKNNDGTTTATSVPSAVIQKQSTTTTTTTTPKPPDKGTCTTHSGTVGVNDIALPIRLLVDRWTFTPNLVSPGTQSVLARIHISDTCGHSVQSAQVWATAIPYNQLSVQQVATDGAGYATLQFQVGTGFPANPGRQQIMAMLIRAFDPSEDPLAGKSTRRVVNLPVQS